MKGVVLETHRKYAIILTDTGSIIRTRNKGYSVGFEIVVERDASQYRFPRILAIAASFVLLLTLTTYAYFTPYSYVSLDVNPSFEFSINRFSRVIDIRTEDLDSEVIVIGMPMMHKDICTAVSMTLHRLDSLAVFQDNEENYVLISAASGNQKQATALLKRIHQTVRTDSGTIIPNLDILESVETLDQIREARNQGTTPGKLRLVQMLRDSAGDTDDIRDEDWVHEPVRNIIKQMHSYIKREAPQVDPGNAHNRQENTESQMPKQDSMDPEDNKGQSPPEDPAQEQNMGRQQGTQRRAVEP